MKLSSSEQIIKSTRVVLPDGIRNAGIVYENGIITNIVNGTSISSSGNVIDCQDAVIMPGLVDSHVHINEPGRTTWEGFETATKAAAAGGITTLVDMPLNSLPVTTTSVAFKEKLSAAKGKLWVDCGFYAGLIPGNAGELQSLIDDGVLGVKTFLVHSGIDEFPNTTEADIRKAMPIIARNNVPLLVHCELTQPNPKPQTSNPKSYQHYLTSRPRQWEHDAIDLMIRLCEEYRCSIHIVHLSSSDELTVLDHVRKKGLPITVETCPHYLYFYAEDIHDGDTRFKCAPPIREQSNREQLWKGLKNNIIDCIVSDHSPCPPEMKLPDEGDFMKAWGGIASLQFGLSIVWTEARARDCSLQDITRWMSTKPAELVGLQKRKGSIAIGHDADFVVWNPDATFEVTPSIIHHKHKVTPYEGRILSGIVEQTYLRGKSVYNQGSFTATASGKSILRNQT